MSWRSEDADWIDGLSAESGRPDMIGRNEDDPKAKWYYEEQIAKVPSHLKAIENVVFVYLLEGKSGRPRKPGTSSPTLCAGRSSGISFRILTRN